MYYLPVEASSVSITWSRLSARCESTSTKMAPTRNGKEHSHISCYNRITKKAEYCLSFDADHRPYSTDTPSQTNPESGSKCSILWYRVLPIENLKDMGACRFFSERGNQLHRKLLVTFRRAEGAIKKFWCFRVENHRTSHASGIGNSSHVGAHSGRDHTW